MKLIGLRTVFAAIASCVLVGCGGGGGDGSGGGSGSSATYSITVTITGLNTGGFALNNSGNIMVIPGGVNSIPIATGVANGTTYSVVPVSQPSGLVCAPVTAGTNVGTVSGANVTIPFACAAAYTVRGTISGLTADGLQIRLFPDSAGSTGAAFNVSPTSGSGSYQFQFAQVRGDQNYILRIMGQPTGLTCRFSNNTQDITGPMNNGEVQLPITCAANGPTYSISATFTNLAGQTGITVLNNGGFGVSIPATNTAVTIATGLATGTAYSLTVGFIPAGYACGPTTNGANVGTIASANITVTFSCAPLFAVNANVQGVSLTGLQLRLFPVLNNTTSLFNLAPTTGGTYTFGAQVRGDGNYAIGIIAQPTGQNCVFGNNTTTVAGPMNNQAQTVNVRCTVTVGGTIANAAPGVLSAGLPSGLALSLDGSGIVQTLNVPAGSSTFTFATPITSGDDYSISIASVPTGISCTVALGKGAANGNVTSVAVRCMDNPTNPLTGVYTIPPAVTGNGRYYFAFFADGTYTFISRSNDTACNFTNVNGTFGNDGNGVEYGIYNYSSATGALSIKYAAVDSNGGCGMVDASKTNINDPTRYFSATLTKSGNNGTLSYVDDNSQTVNLPISAVDSTPSSIVGGFIPTTNNGQFIALHTDSTTPNPMNIYVVPETQFSSVAALPRQEFGCYTFASGQLNVSIANTCLPDGAAAYDLNGTSGLVESGTTGGPYPVTINGANQIILGGDTTLNRTVPN